MNIEKLEQSVRDVVCDLNKDEFIYKLLRAYDQPKASITRLQNGQYNQSKKVGQILWKKKLCFRYEPEGDLHSYIDRLKSDEGVTRHKPRFIIVTDFETLLALDTKTEDTISTPIKELADHFDFFLPWAGMEKSQIQSESLADIKAAEKMGRLYEMILSDNDVKTDEDRHALNIFLSRLLFCFFADDTNIFTSDQFTNAIASHTADDGSDLQGYLQKLFDVLATEDKERQSFPAFLREFPYVNGGLFCEEYTVPVFNRQSRQIIIECGSLNWKAINPDIFGSMIQAVVHSEDRGRMGMHYTSVVNIMKVIEPLFLSELKEELENAGTNKKKLNALLERLYNLRIFDPACGSGNFLIIAYKELCRLEIEIFGRLKEGQQLELRFSKIQLTQFYGIELDDFAHETAMLSLWLAEHQMNLEFKSVFGSTRPTLPLQEGGNIVCGNATREDWEEVCPKDDGLEIYLLGNPPYLGQRNQQDFHREDMDRVFAGISNYKNLDYISIWFLKAAAYTTTDRVKFAFVATNSINQGTQVVMLWPHIFEKGLEIFFAHRGIKWTNSAKNNAGVTVSIIGLRIASSGEKHIFSNGKIVKAKNINGYLADGKNIFIAKRRTTLSALPKMDGGNQPREGGHLILSDQEKENLVTNAPEAEPFLRRLVGTNEFLKGIVRWCIWIREEEVERAIQIEELHNRIKAIRELRTNGNTLEKNFKDFPYRFVQINEAEKHQVIIPVVASERRDYVPAGIMDRNFIVLNSANVIFDAEPFVFGIISSRIHCCWVKAVAGQLETRIRYTSGICFNSFPFPEISEQKRQNLNDLSFAILDERENFSEQTISQLYDPETMPPSLLRAHQALDVEIESCYQSHPFADDEGRLSVLFDLYEKMLADEQV